jgi:hypothetical protein
MVLMGCLLALLSFMQLAVALFCFPLQRLIPCSMLLRSM